MGLEDWQVTYLVICAGIGLVLCGVSFLFEWVDRVKEREMSRLWETLELLEIKKTKEAEAVKEQPQEQ